MGMLPGATGDVGSDADVGNSCETYLDQHCGQFRTKKLPPMLSLHTMAISHVALSSPPDSNILQASVTSVATSKAKGWLANFPKYSVSTTEPMGKLLQRSLRWF